MRRTRRAVICAGLGFFLAGLGQWYVEVLPGYPIDAAIFYVVGLLLFWNALRLNDEEEGLNNSFRATKLSSGGVSSRNHFVLWLFASSLSCVAGLLSHFHPEASWPFPLLFWGGALILVLIPALQSLRRRHSLHSGSFDQREWLVLGGILLVALFTRLVRLGSIPANLSGDEGTMGVLAREFLQGERYDVFATSWFSVPNFTFFAHAAMLSVFGDTVEGLRVLPLLTGFGAVVATYFLVRDLFGVWIAQISTFLLATYAFHVHFSRIGISNVADTLFLSGMLLSLSRSWRKKGENYATWTGLVLGLGWYFHHVSRILIVVFSVLMLYAFTKGIISWKEAWSRGIKTVQAFVVVTFPLGIHFLYHPDSFLARFDQVNIFRSGWLEREASLTGTSVVVLLLEQVARAFLAFTSVVDRSFDYFPERALLLPLASIFFLFGCILCLSRLSRPRYFLVFSSYLCLMVFTAVLAVDAPHSHKIIVVAPLVALITALGIWQLFRIVNKGLGGRTDLKTARALTLLVVVWLGFQNLSFYFFEYQPRRTYGNPNAYFATELKGVLEQEEGPIYIVGAPHFYSSFGALEFLLPEKDLRDLNEPLQRGKLEETDFDSRSTFILHPGRLSESGELEAAFPHLEKKIHRDHEGNKWFVSLRFPDPSRVGDKTGKNVVAK